MSDRMCLNCEANPIDDIDTGLCRLCIGAEIEAAEEFEDYTGLPEDVEFVQELIDTGQAWHFEGAVGRHAMAYIEAGYCTLGETGTVDFWGNYVPSKYEVEPGTKGSPEYTRRMQEEAF